MNAVVVRKKALAPVIIKDTSGDRDTTMATKSGPRKSSQRRHSRPQPSQDETTEMTHVKPREIGEILHQIHETEGSKSVGKDHKRYQIQRAVDLGMRLKDEKIPLKIRKGMIEKHRKRLEKVVQQERDMGLLDERRGLKVSLSRFTDKVVESRSATSTSRAVALSDLHRKTKKVIRERGMSMGTGSSKFKHGTLHLSADDIKRISGIKR